MTKKFTINCDFGGQMSPFAIFVGKPEKGHHALHFQADWLSKARGGMIPGEVMEAVTQLQELAEKNGVALEDLCVYALGTDKQQAELEALPGDGEEGGSVAANVDEESVEESENEFVANVDEEPLQEQTEEQIEEPLQEQTEENKAN